MSIAETEHVERASGLVSLAVSVRMTLSCRCRLGIGEVFESFQAKFVFSDTVGEGLSMEVDGDILEEYLLSEQKDGCTEQSLTKRDEEQEMTVS